MSLTTTREARWDDVGAPVLNNNPGSFIGCIKPFLLTCGWSVIWEDGFKLVMRNSIAHGGSGCYVRFEESSSTLVTIEVFEEMTDIDTGTGTTGSGTSWKSENTASPKTYWILGDERTCYINLFSRDSLNLTQITNPTFIGFGDYESEIPGDVGVFLVNSDGAVSNGASKVNPLFRWNGAQVGDSKFNSTRDSILNPVPSELAPFYNIARTGSTAAPGNNDSIILTLDRLYFLPVIFYGSDGNVMYGRMRGGFYSLNSLTSLLWQINTSTNTFQICCGATSASIVGYICIERIKSWDDI